MSKELSDSFSSLVMMLAIGALQQMGALENPLTKKKETNLELARQTVDVLEMLKEKTRGNLTADETKVLDEMLHDLRLRYVEASAQPPEAPTGAEEKKE